MTLIIAAKCKKGLVVGADKRSTFFTSQVYQDNVDKAFKVNDSVIVLAAGDAYVAMEIIGGLKAVNGIGQMNVEEVKNELEKLVDIKKIRLAQKAIQVYAQLILPIFCFIIAGYKDEEAFIYQVSSQGVDTMKHYEDYLALGLPEISYYLFNKFYHPNMTLNKLSKLISTCISETSMVSSAVSSVNDIIIIKK